MFRCTVESSHSRNTTELIKSVVINVLPPETRLILGPAACLDHHTTRESACDSNSIHNAAEDEHLINYNVDRWLIHYLK